MIRRFIVVTVTALLLTASFLVTGRSHSAAAAGLRVSYAGVNYYYPSDYFTGCGNWTWLSPACYTNATRTSAHISPQQMLTTDLAFLSAHKVGSFQRVWVSLDELFNCWNGSTGYCGYNPQALANLDDALRQFAARGIKTDLVFFSFNQGSGFANQFHAESLDGNHLLMQAGYLRAVRDLLTHLASNAVDASAIGVVDLFNEGYYQLEQYYASAPNLGKFSTCLNPSGLVDTGCVDSTILHPWFSDLYSAARSAAPGFQYTISDTGRLLNTSSSSQSYWAGMYPVDTYDIHLYSDTPAAYAARWATGQNLTKPWFSGEAGCASGNVDCTYDGTKAAAIDQWWLANMQKYGAQAVLIESRHTAWTYPNGPSSQTLTLTGRAVQSANGTDAQTVNVATSTATVAVSPTSMPATTVPPTVLATATPVPPASSTAIPTNTPPPIATATLTNTPVKTATPTNTPAPTNTAVPTSTLVPTRAPLATSTPTPTPVPFRRKRWGNW